MIWHFSNCKPEFHKTPTNFSLSSRSEVDQQLITKMVNDGRSDTEIFSRFESNPPTNKFEEKGASKYQYLTKSIENARLFVQENPLSNSRVVIPSIIQKYEDNSSTMVDDYLPGTGIDLIDSNIGGFTPGHTYIISASQKVGKSAFLINIINYWLSSDKKVCVLNTEQSEQEFFSKLTSQSTGKEYLAIDHVDRKEYLEHFVNEGRLIHLGEDPNSDKSFISDKTGNRSWVKSFKALRMVIQENRPDYLVVDNLTTKKAEWENINHALQQLISLSLSSKTVMFAVIHVNKGGLVKESASRLYKSLKNNDPEVIFSESISIDDKPTIESIKGGSGALSQVKGIFLLWRPFKEFEQFEFYKKTMIIGQSFTGAPSFEVRCDFIPQTMSFENFRKQEDKFKEKSFNSEDDVSLCQSEIKILLENKPGITKNNIKDNFHFKFNSKTVNDSLTLLGRSNSIYFENGNYYLTNK